MLLAHAGQSHCGLRGSGDFWKPVADRTDETSRERIYRAIALDEVHAGACDPVDIYAFALGGVQLDGSKVGKLFTSSPELGEDVQTFARLPIEPVST